MNYLKKFKDILIESIKENKKLIIIFAILFIVLFIATWICAIGPISSKIETLTNATQQESINNTNVDPLAIFINNVYGGLIVYVTSIFFGIGGIISLIYNAINLGAIGALFSVMMPDGGLRYILYLIPHGIFEITATILEPVSGIILFRFVWRFLKGITRSNEKGFKKISSSFKNNQQILIQSLVLFTFTTILLLIAAPIESYISVPFSELILGKPN